MKIYNNINKEYIMSLSDYNVADYKYKDIEPYNRNMFYVDFDTKMDMINYFTNGALKTYFEMNDKYIADSVNFKVNKNGIGFNVLSLKKWINDYTDSPLSIRTTFYGSNPYVYVLDEELLFDTDEVYLYARLSDKVDRMYIRLINELKSIEKRHFNENDPRQKKVMFLKEHLETLYMLGLEYDKTTPLCELGWSNCDKYDGKDLDIWVDMLEKYFERYKEYMDNEKRIFNETLEKISKLGE